MAPNSSGGRRGLFRPELGLARNEGSSGGLVIAGGLGLEEQNNKTLEAPLVNRCNII